MRILIVGATGTIGKAVVQAMGKNHEVIQASWSGEIPVDIANQDSIVSMYESVPGLDAVVSAAGTGKFGSLDQLTDDDFELNFKNKLMGQINLVRIGRAYLNDKGSFTLNSGILAHNQGSGSVIISILNAGIEAFILAASQDMPRGQRLNGVCPPMVRETAQKLGWGQGGVPVKDVAAYYVKSIEGNENGMIYGPLHE